ncbi:MAG: nuclear transport factor 2 family protein, partial [Wenzhouxiangellaceae bacterium]
YADAMYFNDSLQTFTSREPLIEYMQSTAEALEQSTVVINQVMRDGNDVFVRWTMTFDATAMGRPIVSESVGMTHLRFDREGRILVHQDFWDSAAGLYRNLPVVGYALKQVDKRMTK